MIYLFYLIITNVKWLKPILNRDQIVRYRLNFLSASREVTHCRTYPDVLASPHREMSRQRIGPLVNYWGHLYWKGYNTGARYLEYIFNAFISGRAGTPEIAGRYLAVFQVLISSRSRCHPPTHPPTPGGWGREEGRCTALQTRSFDLLPFPPPADATPAFPLPFRAAANVPLATPLSCHPQPPAAA